jgi:hypothetical protein
VIDPADADPETGLERSDDDEGFLARWSRRKQAGYRNKDHPSAPGPDKEPDEPRAADDLPRTTPQPEVTDADMPPLHSLDEKSDYAAFMSPGVSEKLRAQALRKLFHLPGLHVPDGLDDYDDDFTQFAKLGDIVTREMERMLVRERQVADAAEADPQPDQVDVEGEVETGPDDVPDGMAGGEAGDADRSADKSSEQG